MSIRPANRRHPLLAHGLSTYVTTVAWLAAIAIGWWYVADHEFAVNRPLSNQDVDRWPERTRLVRHEGQPTLVLFLHPKCPCSRATLAELYHLYAALEVNPGRPPDLIVVATVPTSADESWFDTQTVQQATRLVNSRLYVDRGGREAARFGATTSGFLMLFDGSGTRRFAGGITVGRGHEGPSAGRDSLTALLRNETGEVQQIPAFGCRLCLPETVIRHDVAKQVGQHGSNAQSG